MKQIYHNYKLWEDFKNGLYKKEIENENEFIELAKNLLSNSDLFYNTMYEMIHNWKYCIEHNLTNLEINPNAYLGAAACNYLYKCNEKTVRIAWNNLDSNIQKNANEQADKIVKIYRSKFKKTIQLCLELI
jgi:hypothetical protein